MSRGWIGVDLDGTLAHYDEWRGVEHIGEPIPEMLDRVKRWVFTEGRNVRIFTARVSGGDPRGSTRYIKEWLVQQGLPILPIVCCKDFDMIELWDDRVVQVEKNTGRPVVK